MSTNFEPIPIIVVVDGSGRVGLVRVARFPLHNKTTGSTRKEGRQSTACTTGVFAEATLN